MAATPKDHVEEIRRRKFKIGVESKSLNEDGDYSVSEDIHQAVKLLSAELYSKDVHFLMELIQNAEDNEYEEGVDPSLEFVITSKDITDTGAKATLLIFNNEKGFSPKNINSICSVARSTKKANRKTGYIGEKGIGFKSVFLITARPYIFSNGYQIRFSEEPCSDCGIGYIVPEWVVDDNPVLARIRQIYGFSTRLPTTTLVLPLKSDKVNPVKHQLSTVHPELLLFLSKIRKLSVREDNEDPMLNTVSTISISSERDFVKKKNIDAESYLLTLAADEKLLVKANEDAPMSTLIQMFGFLPVATSSYPTFNAIRNSIKQKLLEEDIIPCQSYTKQKFFRKPNQVGRLWPTFWNLLNKARRQGVTLHNISSHGTPILNSAFDRAEYNDILNFLDVKQVEDGWYSRCIRSSGLVLGVSEDLYLELLLFVAVNWTESFSSTDMVEIPLLKYVDSNGHVALYSTNDTAKDVHEYAHLIHKSLSHDPALVLTYAHFLYHSHRNLYLSGGQIDSLSSDMPLVDDYGQVTTKGKGVVVPANGMRVTLSSEKTICILEVLKTYAGALDIPNLPPPDATLSSLSSPLTRENAFMLLDWIGNMRMKMPARFLACIQNGSWLKVRLCGNPGYRPPSQSFFHSSSWGHHLQNESLRIDIPLLDQEFYGSQISNYQQELKTTGVMFEFKDVCQFIGKHFMSLAASSTLSKNDVFSILYFIRYLRDKYFSPDEFINSIKDSSWLQTTQGKRSPGQSVFYDNEWAAASQISDIPFVDQNYYGQGILAYKEELKLLGVVFGFSQNFQLVVSNLKPSEKLSSLSAEAALMALDCIHHLNLNSSDRLCRALKENRCLKTVNKGYKFPAQCFLPDPTWACLLQVFDSFPLIDETFYGNRIFCYQNELDNLGVILSFKEVTGKFAHVFRQQSALSKSNALSFLACYRKLKGTVFNLLSDGKVEKCIKEVRWLRTRLGVTSTPKECILFGENWESISSVSLLPFLDDAYYGQDIKEYKAELNKMGVATTFKKGTKFVPASIRLPQNPSCISPSVAVSLLHCIQNLQKDHEDNLISDLVEKLNQKWIKTQGGYRSPKECLLYSSDWNGMLKQEDGPFIDEKFYGPNILSYKKELQALGVVVEVKNGCSLVAGYLGMHSNRATINRIYTYLYKHGWPTSGDNVSAEIWIPNGEDSGKWVSPQDCVFHDKTNLFGSQLFVLGKYYSNGLLPFFRTLGVSDSPGLEDYLKLWKGWECGERRLMAFECCAFWDFVVRNWSSRTKKYVEENLSKLPVCSGPNGILLLDKREVFIADDLYLKELFEKSCVPLFVWYPQPSLPSLPRTKLLNIYWEIGVPSLSESAQNTGLSSIDCTGLERANPEIVFVGNPNMFRLILGFLAQPYLEMEAEKRHESLRRLVNTSFLELKQPITVDYTLSLSSSGKILTAKASRMMWWERERSKFFVTKLEKSDGYKGVLEYATCYSEQVSKGILWEIEDEEEVFELAELIKLGYILKFDEEAIRFLMMTKNLEIFMEDEQFLSSLALSCS
nr:Sacsin like [Ipomoea batatas]